MLFQHRSYSTTVHFGAGSRHRLPEIADGLGLRRILLLCSPGHEELATEAAAGIGSALIGVHPHARMHMPTPLAQQAAERATALEADGCLAIGGGSTIGLGKAIARRTGLPSIAVPTTYSGSEMTPLWGETDGSAKTTGADPIVIPRAVIYDPELTLSIPASITVTSAFNAIAHSAETLYSPEASPLLALAAQDSIRTIMSSIPRALYHPADLAARANLLYGAWLAGTCLSASTMGLHHRLCHVLGGALDLPHAGTHTVLLPYILALNLRHAPNAKTAISAAVGSDHPAQALQDAAHRWGAPKSLADLGMTRQHVPAITAQVLSGPPTNPAPVNETALTHLLHAALWGQPVGLRGSIS